MTEPHEVVPFDPQRTMTPEAPRTIEQRAGAVVGAAAEDGFERLVSYLEQRDAKPAKPKQPASSVARVALGLAIGGIALGAAFIYNHEVKSTAIKDIAKDRDEAIRDLVEVVFDHAECSEASFKALAKNETPPMCPNRASKRDKIDQRLDP